MYKHLFLNSNSKRQNDAKKAKQELPDITSSDSIFQLLSTATAPINPATPSNGNPSTHASLQSPAPSAIAPQTRSSSTRSMPSFTGGNHHQNPQSFTNFIVPDSSALNDDNEEEQKPTAHVPFDWGLKTKLRLLTLSRITGNGLKTCQEASGITRYVIF